MPKEKTRIAEALANSIEKAQRGNGVGELPTRRTKTQPGRIMYVEQKSGNLIGAARIGKVKFSKMGRTLHHGGLKFQSLKGAGFKSNYFCVETGEDYRD